MCNMKFRGGILLLIIVASVSCSPKRIIVEELNKDFSKQEGVILVNPNCGIYEYKDELYYFSETTDLLFKIPIGYLYDNHNTWWGHGLRMYNQDSTIMILVNSFESCLWEELEDEEPYSWWAYCWDNDDFKIHVIESKYGYTKIGFDREYTPIYEKCVMYHEPGIGWRPHIIRMEYQNSSLKEAIPILIDYIESYPDIFPKFINENP